MRVLITVWLLATVARWSEGQNLLQNPGFESGSNHWDCWNFQCTSVTDKHGGQHALKAEGRTHYYQGPAQYITVQPGHTYGVSGWIKLLNDNGGTNNVQLMMDFTFNDNTHDYPATAEIGHAKTSQGWIHLAGGFTAPNREIKSARLYFQSGPDQSVNFVVDDVSVTHTSAGHQVTTAALNQMIDTERKNNINLHVTSASGINRDNVQIRVVQKKKSFPFGSAVNANKYNQNVAGGKYRDFIHKHFNWAVLENALKWPQIEPTRGQKNYQRPLDTIHGLRNHGVKVRGHNLVWSVPQFVQDWVKALSGDQLRNAVKAHIVETMDKTHGLLEHWDVDNENLHGTWYQDRLNDPDYNLQLFRIARNHDPQPKLFLNDYSVVASGASTGAYLSQALKFKNANVGLYGMGVQCHFGNEQEPNARAIHDHLDILAQAGVPIWVTELDVMSSDENRRADYYEKALRALYSHPSVEGILMWGFWDQAHWRGIKAALVSGNDLQLTAAGRRVLDLWENQWMTDETHALTSDRFTVSGFHGDYEVHVMYNGHELTNLRQTFTLGKGDHAVNINVHT